MTDAEYHLLQQSSRLCESRLKLYAEIASLSDDYKAQKKLILADPVQKANEKAWDVVNRENLHKFSHVLLAVLAGSVFCGAMACVQMLLLPTSLLLAIVNPVCSIGAGIWVYVTLHKRYKLKRYLWHRAHYQNKYVQQSEDAERACIDFQKQIQDRYVQYVALERRMQDPTQCSIPKKYWNIGPRLFQMVDTGAARSLDAAIRLYHQPKKQPPAPKKNPAPRTTVRTSTQTIGRTNTAADDARWRELQKMMDEQNAAHTREWMQFIDQMQESAIEYLLINELFD